MSAGQRINSTLAGPDYHQRQRHFYIGDFPIQNKKVSKKNTRFFLLFPLSFFFYALLCSHSSTLPHDAVSLKGCYSAFQVVFLKSALQLVIWDLDGGSRHLSLPLCDIILPFPRDLSWHPIWFLASQVICDVYSGSVLWMTKTVSCSQTFASPPSLSPTSFAAMPRNLLRLQPEDECRRNWSSGPAQSCHCQMGWQGSWPPGPSAREQFTSSFWDELQWVRLGLPTAFSTL